MNYLFYGNFGINLCNLLQYFSFSCFFKAYYGTILQIDEVLTYTMSC